MVGVNEILRGGLWRTSAAVGATVFTSQDFINT